MEDNRWIKTFVGQVSATNGFKPLDLAVCSFYWTAEGQDRNMRRDSHTHNCTLGAQPWPFNFTGQHTDPKQ